MIKLYLLATFINSTHLIYVKRRHKNPILDYNTQHPIISSKFRFVCYTQQDVLIKPFSMPRHTIFSLQFGSSINARKTTFYTYSRTIKRAVAELLVLFTRYDRGGKRGPFKGKVARGAFARANYQLCLPYADAT